MDGKAIGKLVLEVNSTMGEWRNMRRGGNLGMALVAAAISEHAQAVEKLADALRSRREDAGKTEEGGK